MNDAIKSQIQGLSLAMFTAVGCLAYERIVKESRYCSIVFLNAAFYGPLLVGMLTLGARQEIYRICTIPSLKWWALIYFITSITGPLWFVITKKQSVMAGSLYEVKYILILALFYVMVGQSRLTLNLAIACVCALASVYFVSRS